MLNQELERVQQFLDELRSSENWVAEGRQILAPSIVVRAGQRGRFSWWGHQHEPLVPMVLQDGEYVFLRALGAGAAFGWRPSLPRIERALQGRWLRVPRVELPEEERVDAKDEILQIVQLPKKSPDYALTEGWLTGGEESWRVSADDLELRIRGREGLDLTVSLKGAYADVRPPAPEEFVDIAQVRNLLDSTPREPVLARQLGVQIERVPREVGSGWVLRGNDSAFGAAGSARAFQEQLRARLSVNARELLQVLDLDSTDEELLIYAPSRRSLVSVLREIAALAQYR